MKKIGLALGGGGARGVAHIAYLMAMDEMGIRPCVISGTSSGAIAGAMYAGGMSPADMLSILHNLFDGKNKKNGLHSKICKIPSAIVASVVRKELSDLLPKPSFEQLDIPLSIVATNFHTLQEHIFDRGEIIPALMASIAFPNTFAPQQVDGEYYMDGGATNIVPFDIIRGSCDILIAIDVSQVRPVKLNPTAKNAAHATWAATQEALISYKLDSCRVDLFERPTFDENISTMDFQKYDRVYSQAQRFIPDFISKLNKLI